MASVILPTTTWLATVAGEIGSSTTRKRMAWPP
jgi:hypothetical protein